MYFYVKRLLNYKPLTNCDICINCHILGRCAIIKSEKSLASRSPYILLRSFNVFNTELLSRSCVILYKFSLGIKIWNHLRTPRVLDDNIQIAGRRQDCFDTRSRDISVGGNAPSVPLLRARYLVREFHIGCGKDFGTFSN